MYSYIVWNEKERGVYQQVWQKFDLSKVYNERKIYHDSCYDVQWTHGNMASAVYAEQVLGEVRAVVGTELRSGNIWENVELPRLMENPNVTKITIIDPKTGKETDVFER